MRKGVIFKHNIKVKIVLTLIWIGLDVPLIFNLGWNGFGSNFTGWVGIGAENLPREDLYLPSFV